ncbi:Dam family site-specific DNA-(adenine-N6)-methyltransferase [Acidobacteria bacterium AB60]|nr:Dam family site-specific DNA-(adenine-N6)-methyltransferase [Acidobacteria bacterium AB60]
MSGDYRTSPAVAPILRWAGSKRKLIPELLKHAPKDYVRYIEPFCGSACLFFSLRPKNAMISDLNRELIEAYRTLAAHPKLVHRAVVAMPRTNQFYYRLRRKDPASLDEISRAARFVYLNRNCFNGVFRLNRAGKFNVPRGSRAGETPSLSQFLQCALLLRKADLRVGDFESATSKIRHGDFVYLDPPYAKRGSRRRGEYGYASFDIPDLARLERVLRAINDKGATFLLSYDCCPEIESISRAWYWKSILVRRHVAGFNDHRAIVRERLISNREFNY